VANEIFLMDIISDRIELFLAEATNHILCSYVVANKDDLNQTLPVGRRQPCKWVAALEEWTPFCETFRITVKSFFQLECLQDLEFIIPGSEAKY